MADFGQDDAIVSFGGDDTVVGAGDPVAANDILNNGLLFNATPEQSSAINGILSPQDMEANTSKAYYDNKFGTNHTPEMVEAQIRYEYGDDATPQVANQMNKKGASYQKAGVKEFAGTVFGGFQDVTAAISEAAGQAIEPMINKWAFRKEPGDWKPSKRMLERYGEEEARAIYAKAKTTHEAKTRGEVKEEVAEIFSGIGREIVESKPEWVEESKRVLEEELSQGDMQFLKKGAALIALNAPNLVASGNIMVGLPVMYSQERKSMDDELEAVGLSVEERDQHSAIYGAVSGSIEYVENLGRLKSAFGKKAAGSSIRRQIIKKLATAGVNVTEEVAQQLVFNVVYNDAVTKHNEATGDAIALKEIPEGLGEAATGSLAMTTVLEAMGLSTKGLRTAWTLGDANRTRKQNSNEEIAKIVANDPSVAEDPEGGAVLTEALETPSEATVGALNAHLFAGEEVTTPEGEPIVLGEGFVKEEIAEKVPTEAGSLELLPESASITEVSDQAQKILGFGEKIKGKMKPFLSVTTRLKEIAPRVSMAVRGAEQKMHHLITANTEASRQFIQTVNKTRKGMTQEESDQFTADILNGNWTALEARGVEGVAEIRQMFTQTAEALGIESIENYFRRRVKDYDGLVEHLGEQPRGEFKRALDDAQKKKGRELTKQEKATAIRGVLRQGKGDGLKQRRTIETVTSEMAKFYEDPIKELSSYIRRTAQAIARKEELGVAEDIGDEIGEVAEAPIDDTIDNIIAEMVGEGELTKKQETELKELLKSRLQYKEAGKIGSLYRRLVSLKYVTKLKTMVKQMGDIFVAIGENGFDAVAGSPAEASKWKDDFGRDVKLSLEEIGVNALDIELQDQGAKRAEEIAFKPLTAADVIGKSALLKSTARRWRKLASNNPVRLKKILMDKFGHEEFVNQITKDMKTGTATRDVFFALYSQMADFHPISHSEHIKFYIDNPKMRFLFVLKSFAFKRLDRLYREAVSKGVDGTAKYVAGKVDGNEDMIAEGADQVADGVVGMARFLVWSVAAEVAIEKAYKEIAKALGWKEDPEEEKDDMWVNMYMQELARIHPFIDPYGIENAIERKDAWAFVEKTMKPAKPIGFDTLKSLAKGLSDEDAGLDLDEYTDWKKDVPYLGEFMWGAEKARE